MDLKSKFSASIYIFNETYHVILQLKAVCSPEAETVLQYELLHFAIDNGANDNSGVLFREINSSSPCGWLLDQADAVNAIKRVRFAVEDKHD